jgi:prepilin-type N-terminal cleavage/methylation domain-containing protein
VAACKNLGARAQRAATAAAGFTLLELVLVIVIVGLTIGVSVVRLDSFSFWKEQAALRKLSELIVFLNNQAIMDQAFYRLEFDLEKNSYRVGVMRAEDPIGRIATGANLPPLELELAALLSPSLDGDVTMIPPPSFPSLAEPTELPPSLIFEDIVTPRGTVGFEDDVENPYLLFSPRGSSEFGVLHLATKDAGQITILVNPWTGLAEVYRGRQEFEWTLGKTPR